MRRIAILVTAFWWGGAGPADAQSLVTLDVPGSSSTEVRGINSFSEAVGSFTQAGVTRGFLYRDGSFSRIEVPGATETRALGINDAGQIVGTFADAQGEHGFLDADGTFTVLDVPGAVSTRATEIDNAGDVTGTYSDGNGRVRGYRNTGGIFLRVDRPGGSSVATGVSPGSITSRSAVKAMPRASSGAGACDVTGNGVVDVFDVQKVVNEALGVATMVDDLNADHVVNVADVLIVTHAALGLGCTASGQGTAAVSHLTVQSGNGQVACICIGATLQHFQPISVKATDTSGRPVVGATVTWTVTSGQMTVANPTSTTDSNGIATQGINLVVFNNFSSTSVPYLVSTVQATSNNVSLTFTETQSLISSQGSSVILANPPQFGGVGLYGNTLSAHAGTTLSTPIQTNIGGTGVASNGVPNVSVRVVNQQASPTVTCVTGGNNVDPGAVLSDAQGNTSCYLMFSGTGNGTFYLSVGGPTANDIGSALYLTAIGPYNFTSLPGGQAAAGGRH